MVSSHSLSRASVMRTKMVRSGITALVTRGGSDGTSRARIDSSSVRSLSGVPGHSFSTGILSTSFMRSYRVLPIYHSPWEPCLVNHTRIHCFFKLPSAENNVPICYSIATIIAGSSNGKQSFLPRRSHTGREWILIPVLAGGSRTELSSLRLPHWVIAGSSNGRTAPFGGVYLGSNPSPAANS